MRSSKCLNLSTFVAAIFALFLVVVQGARSAVNCQCRIKNSAISTIEVACKNMRSGSPVCSKAVRPFTPTGYHYIPGLGLYKLHTLGKSYDDGQRTCAKEGARLAIPQNEAMAGAMAKFYSPDSGIIFAFVGINDLASTGFYQGSDGQLAPWLNWANGEPNNADGKEHCVALGKDKLMNDFPCDRIYPFFCERRMRTPVPQGYAFVEGHGFYKVYKDKATFHEAEDKCQEDGAHLAVPETQPEAEAIVQVTKADWNLGAVWIGISDEVHEGSFITVHGSAMDDLEFDNWSEGEPNDANGNEDCATFLPYGYLNDATCTDQKPFICELVI